MIVLGVVLLLTVIVAVAAVLARELIVAAIGLAIVSALIACVLFALHLPLAGVFELSVCAGLITVVFVSVISLTQPQSTEPGRGVRRAAAYGLIALVVAAAVGLFIVGPGGERIVAPQAPGRSVGELLWGERRFDLVGQIAAILTGVLGVVVLFRSRRGAQGGARDSASDGAEDSVERPYE